MDLEDLEGVSANLGFRFQAMLAVGLATVAVDSTDSGEPVAADLEPVAVDLESVPVGFANCPGLSQGQPLQALAVAVDFVAVAGAWLYPYRSALQSG